MNRDNGKERPGFDRRMTRDEINACPIRRNELPVHVIRNREQLDGALHALGREKILGFDTETRPAFHKGQSFPPSLIQLAGHKSVYIFQLRHTKFPRKLREILAAPEIIKAGVALEQDVVALLELGSFKHAGFVDLGLVAKKAGIKNHGLRGMAAAVLGYRISKRAQRSNWSRESLTPAQVGYAAMDAWVSRELYIQFTKLGYKKLVEPMAALPRKRSTQSGKRL